MLRVPLLLLLTCAACAPSALIRADDATFARAQRDFARGVEATQVLAASQPATTVLPAAAGLAPETPAAPLPAPDAVLWLQAEALYHYRFDAGGSRSTASYVAQLAAAATDFAPFLVAASSEGMMELRLRSYDGAAQLYEELLARHPGSTLRPLALYRLGWAYRNTLTEGFPRDSAQSLQQLQKEHPDSSLALLAKQVEAVPWKSQDTAALWSLVPGAGQLYVGETANGLVRLGISLGLAALTVVPLVALAQEGRVRWFPIVLSSAGIAGLQVSYTAAYQDSRRAVLEYNERQEAAFRAAHPDAP